MARIEIDVSPELAARLQHYQGELPRLLERALDEVERDRGAETRASEGALASLAWREQWQAFAQAVGEAWPAGTSALETLASMRR